MTDQFKQQWIKNNKKSLKKTFERISIFSVHNKVTFEDLDSYFGYNKNHLSQIKEYEWLLNFNDIPETTFNKLLSKYEGLFVSAIKGASFVLPTSSVSSFKEVSNA